LGLVQFLVQSGRLTCYYAGAKYTNGTVLGGKANINNLLQITIDTGNIDDTLLTNLNLYVLFDKAEPFASGGRKATDLHDEDSRAAKRYIFCAARFFLYAK